MPQDPSALFAELEAAQIALWERQAALERSEKGLSEDVIRFISAKKNGASLVSSMKPSYAVFSAAYSTRTNS